jgi:nucleoside-diphosphate-sugar epimerase
MAFYLVTGGAGFIGSHLAAALAARGDRVRVFDDLSTGRRENLAGLLGPGPGRGAGAVELVTGDLADAAAVRAACRGVDGIFHEAAQVSVPQSLVDPVRSYAVNVGGTLHVLEGARAEGVGRVVFAASSAAYGESEELPKAEHLPTAPLSPYASGKVAGEQLMAVYGHAFGLRTASLRYFNVFGPRQLDDSPYTGVIAIFARALLEGRRPTIYGDGQQTRDFTYVANAVAANLLAMDRDELPAGVVINVGGGERITIRQLFAAMAEELGSGLEPVHAPARAGDVRHSLASLARARELLGYEPAVHWRAGLATTLAWYRERFGARRLGA